MANIIMISIWTGKHGMGAVRHDFTFPEPIDYAYAQAITGELAEREGYDSPVFVTNGQG